MSKEQKRVRDVMITNFVSLRPDVDIYRGIEIIVDKGLMGAPVVEHNKLVGVFSEKDAFRVMANWAFEVDNEIGGTVGDHMTRDVVTIDAGTQIASLTSKFLQHFFRGLPVVDDGELVGLVSRRDILKALMQMGKEEVCERFASDRYASGIPGIT